jgi:hypothetical protein
MEHGVKQSMTHHRGQNALDYRTQDIKHIAGEPDNDELQRQAIGAAATKVLDDLGTEYDDPTGDGYGTVGASQPLKMLS